MDKENEGAAEVEEVDESLDLPEVPEGEEDTTDWQSEAQKLREKAIAQRERTKKLRQELKDARKAVEVVATAKPTQSKTGELDETQLDYLDLKGVSETEDIDVIQKVIARTGQTVRQALKDEYVMSKLEANKKARELKDATPSATKRGASGGTNDFAIAYEKYDRTGELPADFELRKQVVNKKLEQETGNKPAWH